LSFLPRILISRVIEEFNVTTREWSIQAKDQDGNDISAQISGEFEAILQATRLEQIAPGRISLLFLLSFFGAYKAGRINPFQIAREIESLEKGDTTGLKPPIQNRHAPLKGLWHKHYMQPGMASLAMNIQHGLKQYGIPYLAKKVQEAKESGEERYFTIEDVVPMANDAVQGNWQRLREAERLTGEWIVFAKHEGLNYYLTLTTHDKAMHQHDRQQIENICYREFSFLEKILRDGSV
jgi:hypothetical protein